jgi:hypothetical protein
MRKPTVLKGIPPYGRSGPTPTWFPLFVAVLTVALIGTLITVFDRRPRKATLYFPATQSAINPTNPTP